MKCPSCDSTGRVQELWREDPHVNEVPVAAWGGRQPSRMVPVDGSAEYRCLDCNHKWHVTIPH